MPWSVSPWPVSPWPDSPLPVRPYHVGPLKVCPQKRLPVAREDSVCLGVVKRLQRKNRSFSDRLNNAPIAAAQAIAEKTAEKEQTFDIE